MVPTTSTSSIIDVYQIVTDRIIALLEQGTLPWQKPWATTGIPRNLLSKRPYRGINLWLLLSLNYEQNLFLTWDQVKQVGGSVNKGETGQVVIFWKTAKKEETVAGSEEKQKTTPVLRYYKVFNIAQCSNIPTTLYEQPMQQEIDPLTACENIITGMPGCPPIRHKEHKAYYHIEEDYINLPKRKSFASSESYYSTLFHELVHSTGHEKRLNRATITQMAEFGSEPYSIEELIAELGSCYLCNHTGILNPEVQNSAAYINGWLGMLKKDKRFIVQASAQAQKAVDCILNMSAPTAENGTVEQPEIIS